MGAKCHVFLTTGCNNRCVTQLDVLCTQCDSAQTRATNLIDAPSGAFDWQTCVDVCLSGWVLALTAGQNLTKDRFRNVRFLDACPLNQSLQNGRAKIVGWGVCERATKAANSSTGGGYDYDVGSKLFFIIDS